MGAIEESGVAGESRRREWLNRNVVGMGLTSFLSDAGHEMATAVLPGFLAVIGAPAAALGVIEGVADAASSFVKLAAGWYSDRIGHRKAMVTGGYLVTGVAKALFALAYTWPLVLVGRTAAWLGRGVRSPLRDAILAESVPPASRGRAFGFHRAGDTFGAIVGPAIAVAVLAWLQPHAAVNPSAPFRLIFWLTLIPGVSSAVAFAALVSERRRAANHELRFWGALRSLPSAYRRLLVGVGVFGLADFAPTLMILAATQLLTPGHGVVRAAQIAGLLYMVRNVAYAGASFPIGALSDRVGRRGLLVAGYLVAAVVAAGFMFAFLSSVHSIAYLLALFVLAGIYIAAEDALEGIMTADYTAPEVRATAYGLLATVNGVGDFAASAAVGLLWTALSPAVGFGYAAVLMLVGAAILHTVR
jgi:MFS family permease